MLMTLALAGLQPIRPDPNESQANASSKAAFTLPLQRAAKSTSVEPETETELKEEEVERGQGRKRKVKTKQIKAHDEKTLSASGRVGVWACRRVGGTSAEKFSSGLRCSHACKNDVNGNNKMQKVTAEKKNREMLKVSKTFALCSR